MSAKQPLVVFSDDWGRHPSSCQHLIRELLPRYEVLWVNTIGSRRVRFDVYTLRRGLQKISGWFHRRPSKEPPSENAPKVLNPPMWPGFGSRIARGVNRRLLARALRKAVGTRRPIVLTTIPLVADLVGHVPAERWIYYCVDDFSLWPGLDGPTLHSMEAELISKVDEIAVVNETLQKKMASLDRSATVISHGVDLNLWRSANGKCSGLVELKQPVVLFWGLIDERLNVEWIERLAEISSVGAIVLVGPNDNADARLKNLAKVRLFGSRPLGDLPALARQASVLIMPYAELPVTRAMQPLKFKEYLATGKPTVAVRLPAVEEWSDAADLVADADEFVAAVMKRIEFGVDERQLQARHRLESESWAAKARQLEQVWRKDAP